VHHKHLMSSTLLANCWTVCFVSFPSNQCMRGQHEVLRVANMPGLPFMTVVTLLSIMCVSFRISAAAIRASSCVNLSNRLSASSISFFPMSFFRYFSEHRLADNYISPRATHLLDLASSLSLQSRRCPEPRPLSSRLCRSLRLLAAPSYKTRGA
jgi:hypothetical protein